MSAGCLRPLRARDPGLGFPRPGAVGQAGGPRWGSSGRGQRKSPLLWDGTARDGGLSPRDRRDPGRDGAAGGVQPALLHRGHRAGGLNNEAAGQDVAVCPVRGVWFSPDDAARSEGTHVAPWEVARAGTHPPGSAGCSSEQGARTAGDPEAVVPGSPATVPGTGWALHGPVEGLPGGPDPKTFPPLTAPVKLKRPGSGAGHRRCRASAAVGLSACDAGWDLARPVGAAGTEGSRCPLPPCWQGEGTDLSLPWHLWDPHDTRAVAPWLMPAKVPKAGRAEGLGGLGGPHRMPGAVGVMEPTPPQRGG